MVFETRLIRLGRWTAALFFGVILHASAIGVVFMAPEAVEDNSDAGAFMIELAPMAVSPTTQETTAAIGPPQQEAPDVVESQEKTKPEPVKTEDTPPVPETEHDPVDPDLKLAKAEPEKKEEKVEEKPEEPEKEVQETEQPEAAASQAAQEMAPPPADAVGEKPAAPSQGLSESDKKAIETWHKKLVVHLNGHKRYPAEARKKRIEGEVVVKFTLDRDGKVVARAVLTGSGAQILDDAAIEILERASPLPVPPRELAGNNFELTLPIQYQVK